MRCRRCNETDISLRAGCELFLRYATRISAQEGEAEDFAKAKARIVEVGRHISCLTTLKDKSCLWVRALCGCIVPCGSQGIHN